MKRPLRILVAFGFGLLAISMAARGQVAGSIAAPAQTGQTLCYDETGATPNAVTCSGTGQDGDLRMGIKWTMPRFVINANGTVTDTFTRLTWLQNGNCIEGEYPGFDTDGTVSDGLVLWDNALAFVAGINDGTYPACGAGSTDWRLPNIREMNSLLHHGYALPSLCNTSCTGQWSDGEPFTNLTTNQTYWSSTTAPAGLGAALTASIANGHLGFSYRNLNHGLVWPVRGGRITTGTASIVLPDGGIQFPDGSLQVSSGGGSPLPLLRTGQYKCYQSDGVEIACAGTGQDGEFEAGEPWPTPRFTKNGDGTVTDNLTSLVWLEDSNCKSPIANWADAIDTVEALYDGSISIDGGDCGLDDNSKQGEWRLPTFFELLSLFDYRFAKPAISNAAGDGQWTEGDPFTNVTSIDIGYWSSTNDPNAKNRAWIARIGGGYGQNYLKSDSYPAVWPVRGGR